MEENIDVVPSEDNGNVPAETVAPIAPSEQPNTETPAEVVETAKPATASEPELFELPDGRKVDGATLYKEHVENLLPDYTKKSQELAELKRGNLPTNEPTEKPYEKPDWQPNTWAEAIQLAKHEALQEIENKEKAKIEEHQARIDRVTNELAEVKKIDPAVNENALFIHANEYRTKYGVQFPSLQSAYQHMKDTAELTKKVQTTTAANIARRNDPVSISPGATGARPDPSQFGSAREYLRSLK